MSVNEVGGYIEKQVAYLSGETGLVYTVKGTGPPPFCASGWTRVASPTIIKNKTLILITQLSFRFLVVAQAAVMTEAEDRNEQGWGNEWGSERGRKQGVQ